MEKLKIALLSLFLFTLMINSTVSAQGLSNIKMTLSTNEIPSDTVSSCPDSIISSDILTITLTNNGESTDTILLTLDWVENSGFILPEMTLASGESKTIEPLWLTVPYTMEPGTYAARIEAKSSLTGETTNIDIKVNVLRCRSVDISVSQNFQETCKEDTQPVQYSATVTNNGKWDETFQLSADKSWVILSDSTVYLMPGESRVIGITADPPAGLEGNQKITITAKPTDSRFSYIKDTENLFLDIKDCHRFVATIRPSETTACTGQSKVFTLEIDNTGSIPDTYQITAPDWIQLTETVVSIDASETKEIQFTALPEISGSVDFTIEVRSLEDEMAIQNPSATITVEDCRGFEIVQTDVEKTVCAGLVSDNFTLQLRNTGNVENELTLSTTYGSLSESKITIPPGELRQVVIEVISPATEGVQEFSVTITDGINTRVAEMRMISESCYSVEMVIEPEEQTSCPFTTVEYLIDITNTGNLPDTYTVSYGVGRETVTLPPGESATMFFLLPANYEEAGVYAIRVNLTSENGVELSRIVTLNVKGMQECYSVLLTDGDGTVETGHAIGKEINVKNMGEVAQTFSLSLDAPDWVLIKPVTVDLEPGEEESVYVYISPLFATQSGEYDVKVKADSQHTSGDFDLRITVPDGITPPDQNVTEPPKPPVNETNRTGPGTNITLNVSTGEGANDSDSITGGVVGEDSTGERSFRTMAIAIIAIIIIIILAARFVLLFKK